MTLDQESQMIRCAQCGSSFDPLASQMLGVDCVFYVDNYHYVELCPSCAAEPTRQRREAERMARLEKQKEQLETALIILGIIAAVGICGWLGFLN